MKRRCDTYIQWNITQPLKKHEIIPFAAIWMALEIAILSEVSQRRRNIVSHPLDVESIKY